MCSSRRIWDQTKSRLLLFILSGLAFCSSDAPTVGESKRSKRGREAAEENTLLFSRREQAGGRSPDNGTTRHDMITNLYHPLYSTTPFVNPTPVPATAAITIPSTIPGAAAAASRRGGDHQSRDHAFRARRSARQKSRDKLPFSSTHCRPDRSRGRRCSARRRPGGDGSCGTDVACGDGRCNGYCAADCTVDYACGIGGADCPAIQQTGTWLADNPNKDHASYAFHGCYRKSPPRYINVHLPVFKLCSIVERQQPLRTKHQLNRTDCCIWDSSSPLDLCE